MICVKEIKKSFGDAVVLDNLSLTMQKGSIYGLIGHNGSGKTTLLKSIAGIYGLDSGSIFVDGQAVFDNEQIKRRMFFIPDEHYFLSQANMDTMARFYKGFYPGWSDVTFKRLTEIFEIDPSEKLTGLSKGMQQQVAIILALSTRPDYLLLDECFDGLDPVKRSLVRRLLTELVAEKEIVVMISSHNIRELEDLCDHIGIINNKQIIYDSSVCEMRQGMNKYRLAFKKSIAEDALNGFIHKNLVLNGKVATFVAGGDEAEIRAQTERLDPVLVQVSPLTLEEVFLIEMEEKEYDFRDIV
ncbi:ABC transporter ATP-binding protein [Dethiobacter alkaliphilus]|uniref:ABC transporter related protein n=1 Tax=Dethiobacter alkaliphilus AHT 1 TaxID=555088 RepID=C0GE95_DETAL|nr:ABC transporter ATP-binding protein [Dethiobacter alkaliphilus]EEG78389.1 ABC transporter related protein [Dethiobacter alkaliphilus AHT 1]